MGKEVKVTLAYPEHGRFRTNDEIWKALKKCPLFLLYASGAHGLPNPNGHSLEKCEGNSSRCYTPSGIRGVSSINTYHTRTKHIQTNIRKG